MADADEETIGKVVVVNWDDDNDNVTPDKDEQPVAGEDDVVSIVLQGAQDVVLTKTAGASKIRVWTSQSKDTEITFNGTDNRFSASVLPVTLWVEGVSGSVCLRDVELKLTNAGGNGKYDKVRLTALEVIVTGAYSGTLSAHNAAREEWYTLAVPHNYNLGDHIVCSYELLHRGNACEFRGQVKPPGFIPEGGKSLYLARYKPVASQFYWGPNGNENNTSGGAGNDTSDPRMRDDNPAPNGYIYDIDAPGVPFFWWDDPNTIARERANFTEYAVYGDQICSSTLEWHCAKSIKKTGAADSGTATDGTLFTLTDTTKNWPVDSWTFVKITGGTAQGKVREVTTNSATEIWVRFLWNPFPDNTSTYKLNTSTTWTLENGVQGDNAAGDGYLQYLTWDLQP